MRKLALLVLSTVLVTGVAAEALADGTPQQYRRPVARQARRPMQPMRGGNPNDAGPYTPEANRAYQGGGVILEGAPGAPAPTPRPMPPGR